MNQYRYTKYHYKPKRRTRKLIVTIIILVIIGGGAFSAVFFLNVYSIYSSIVDLYRLWFNDYGFLEKHLQTGQYNIVIHNGLPYLARRPHNPRLLRYIGESYYYISTSLTDEEKEESIDRAIFYLRKGIVLSQMEEVLTNTYYVLGMCYFRKGQAYYELAVDYLKKALDGGHEDESLYEILGYCYFKIGALQNAAKYLEKAKEAVPKDVVRLYLAHTYTEQEKYESAVRELRFIIENTADDVIYDEAFAALVWIDFHEERFDEVRRNIELILEKNKDSAFAHFWLGNLYEREGDLLSARKEWRRTLKIDPKHIGAIEKLY